ncbi:MAG: hypothetical protein V2A34_11210 [Lentisphaerota bacterium]
MVCVADGVAKAPVVAWEGMAESLAVAWGAIAGSSTLFRNAWP